MSQHPPILAPAENAAHLHTLLADYGRGLAESAADTAGLIELWNKDDSLAPREHRWEFDEVVIDPTKDYVPFEPKEFLTFAPDDDVLPTIWRYPTIFLGSLWQEHECDVFVLPANARLPRPWGPRLDPLDPAVGKLLMSLGWDGGRYLPEAPYYEERYGRLPMTISVRHPVVLEIRPGDAGEPKAMISIGASREGKPICLVAPVGESLAALQDQLSSSLEAPVDTSDVSEHENGSFLAVARFLPGDAAYSWEAGQHMLYDGFGNPDAEMSYLDRSYTLAALDALNDSDLHVITDDGSSRFVPAMKLCADFGAAPHQSIAAALLSNLSCADEFRVDKLLLRRAEDISHSAASLLT
jgi:hypothetical protein